MNLDTVSRAFQHDKTIKLWGTLLVTLFLLAIPPTALAQQAGYGLRGWALRHRWAKATAQPA